MPSSIHKFANDLAGTQPPKFWNMYSEVDTFLEPMYAPTYRRKFLVDYLEARQGVPYALVGLAPGYAGARFSGEPFNDERHVFEKHGVRLSKRVQPWSEESSNIVQSSLVRLAIAEDTVCWNAIPFHPCLPGNPLANRTPEWSEVQKHGLPWLERFLKLMKPGTVIPVGRIAEKAVAELGITNVAPYVRHPSHGGNQLFFRGLMSIVNGNAEEKQAGSDGGQHPSRGREEPRLPEGE